MIVAVNEGVKEGLNEHGIIDCPSSILRLR